MSYRVFARRYRSQTFDEIVGQEVIATTLKNAVKSGRVHHGYLFTGTRGVGKTSMARILAKALNCESSDKPTPTPCCKCESCLAIAEGEDIDVVEIDAASNTGVDNIRELRGNAVYRPARSRFKVYIIDEVHMLSAGAFNALLKTLEEPPSHVKFILATTEAHKIPPTIKSRCQCFFFRSIDPEAIAGQLDRILKQEKVKADDEVVRRIARLARGSMRDALSLLDQVLSYAGDRLSVEVADEVLPLPHDEVICQLVDGLAEGDAAAALNCVERSLNGGNTPERFCETLIEHLRTLMLFRLCGADTELVDVPGQARERLVEQSAKFDATTYVYMISLCEELRRAVKSSGAARCLLDAAVVRLAMTECFSDVRTLLDRLGKMPDVPSVAGGQGRSTGANTGEAKSQSSGSTSPTPTRPNPGKPRARSSDSGRAGTADLDASSGTQAVTSTSSGTHAVTSSAKKEALESPVVRAAMGLFDGRPVHVRSGDEAAGATDTESQESEA